MINSIMIKQWVTISELAEYCQVTERYIKKILDWSVCGIGEQTFRRIATKLGPDFNELFLSQVEVFLWKHNSPLAQSALELIKLVWGAEISW
jgi:hypothetical protein